MKNPFEVFRQKDFLDYEKRINGYDKSKKGKQSNEPQVKDTSRQAPKKQAINKSFQKDTGLSEKQKEINAYIKQTQQYLWRSNKKIFNKRSNRRQLKELSDDISSRNRQYEFTNEDAKQLTKEGCEKGEIKFTVEECRQQMKKQLRSLNTDYKYNFYYEESPQVIDRKTMTRTIYLYFKCNKCNENAWTSISGTFQVTFQYQKINKYFLFDYHIRVFRTKCRLCKQYMEPLVYQTQMKAMKIFFSVIIINIVGQKLPPQKPQKYYIKPNHWHKAQWCQACELDRCTTQNHVN